MASRDDPRSHDPSAAPRLLRWPLPLAALWLMIPVVGIVTRLSLDPVAPHDYWWSLTMGKLIAWNAEIPTENLFLYTMPADAPFIVQPWLGQWLLYVLMEAGGHAGPIVVRNVVALLTWAGLVGISLGYRPVPRVVGGVGLLAVAVGSPVFAVRTQMFAFLPYVALVAVVLGVAGGRLRQRWLLAPAALSILWANLHGSFVLAAILPGLCGAAIALEDWLESGRIRRAHALGWAGATLLAAGGAMVNPRGAAIYRYVWDLTVTSPVSGSVTEWQPPDVTSAYGVVVLAVFVAMLVILGLRRNQARLYEVVLLCATAYLAMGAVRHMFWWAALLLVIMPGHVAGLMRLKPWWTSPTSAPQGAVHATFAALLLGVMLLSQPGLWLYNTAMTQWVAEARQGGPGRHLLARSNATRLVQGLATAGYPGRIFHSQELGGLLEYVLGTAAQRQDEPLVAAARQVAFVDQRMEMIPEAIWDEYFSLSSAEPGWQQRLQRDDIRTLLLSPQEQAGLVAAAGASAGWQLVGVDEAHVLYFRADATDAIAAWALLDRTQNPAEHRQGAGHEDGVDQ